MTPELGTLALILALLVALLQGVLPLLGASRGHTGWMALAGPAAHAQSLLVAFAFGCLVNCFAAGDFSVAYVVAHSNAGLPLLYRAAATWSGHEGSMLLWLLMLAGWTTAVSLRTGAAPLAHRARVLSVLGLLSAGFLLFVLATSNPFDRQWPAATDGRDLSPLLQDPGLIFHPPLLYMGYVGLAVPFAFAVSALLGGEVDAAWARASRPWTLVAWLFLTLGIALGSYWAYYELGWGGWWFWDPVENASFMPWLIAAALIHSLAVSAKRGSFLGWTVLLAIAAFSLSLLGTFLVRSGVLSSVHAFAADPRRGLFILFLLSLVVGATLALYAWRAPRLPVGGGSAWLSRESLLLTNNVLLAVAAATVLLGTLYPLIVDALGGGKLSVGPPYFNSVFVPLMLPLLVLLGIGPWAAWREARLVPLLLRLRGPAVLALLAVGLPALAGPWKPGVAMGLVVAVWIAANSAAQAWQRLRDGRPALAYWGMQCAHLGVAVFVAGVSLVQGYAVEREVRMAVGDSVQLASYELRLRALEPLQGPNYLALRAEFELRQDREWLRLLQPEKRRYASSPQSMTETAIASNLWRDVYVSLGEPLNGPDEPLAWSVRVHLKPFVVWIWAGCLLMACGGGLAALDRRVRSRRAAARAVQSQASEAWA